MRWCCNSNSKRLGREVLRTATHVGLGWRHQCTRCAGHRPCQQRPSQRDTACDCAVLAGCAAAQRALLSARQSKGGVVQTTLSSLALMLVVVLHKQIDRGARPQVPAATDSNN